MRAKIDARVQLGSQCDVGGLRRALLRITVLRYRCLKWYTGGRARKFEVVVCSTRFMCRECLTPCGRSPGIFSASHISHSDSNPVYTE